MSPSGLGTKNDYAGETISNFPYQPTEAKLKDLDADGPLYLSYYYLSTNILLLIKEL